MKIKSMNWNYGNTSFYYEFADPKALIYLHILLTHGEIILSTIPVKLSLFSIFYLVEIDRSFYRVRSYNIKSQIQGMK